MSTGSLLRSRLECGPTTMTPVKLMDENELIRSRIIEQVPGVCMDTMVSRPNWVYRDGVTYKNNNAYVVIGHDGMDPMFAIIEELIVIGGDMVLFCVRNCNVRYFDDHYHAYVVDHTSQQSLTVELLDRNVYYAHVMSDNLSYITLNHSFMYISLKKCKKCYYNPTVVILTFIEQVVITNVVILTNLGKYQPPW